MIEACYRLGIQVLERPFTLEELKTADEVLVTSSSNFCLHANEIDGVPVGGKDPLRLKQILNEVVEEYLRYTGKKSMFDNIGS
jgi:D-alanine transaminase